MSLIVSLQQYKNFSATDARKRLCCGGTTSSSVDYQQLTAKTPIQPLFIISDGEVFKHTYVRICLFIFKAGIGIVSTVATDIICRTDPDIYIVLPENFKRKSKVHLLEAD